MNDGKSYEEMIAAHVAERLRSNQQINPGDVVVSRDGREYYVSPDGSWHRLDKLKGGRLPGGKIVETKNGVISRSKPSKKSIRKAKNGITTANTEGKKNGAAS